MSTAVTRTADGVRGVRGWGQWRWRGTTPWLLPKGKISERERKKQKEEKEEEEEAGAFVEA